MTKNTLGYNLGALTAIAERYKIKEAGEKAYIDFTNITARPAIAMKFIGQYISKYSKEDNEMVRELVCDIDVDEFNRKAILSSKERSDFWMGFYMQKNKDCAIIEAKA